MSKRRGHGEGSIYQMADGRWRAAVSLGWQPDENGKPVWKRKTITKATRAEVQEELTRVLRNQQLGISPAPEKNTLGQYLHHWLENIVKTATRPKTYRSYEQMVRNHIAPGLGTKKLAKLTLQDVQAFMAERLDHGCKPALVRYLRTVLRIALNEAMRSDLVVRNVAALTKPPRASRQETQTFTQEQARQFLAAIQGHRLEAVFTVALALGLRHGEALALLDTDVDFQKGTLRVFYTLQRIDGKLQRVETKSEKGRRMVPLPAICVEALRRHLARREQERLLAGADWVESRFLFTSTRGTPLIERNVLRSFKSLLTQSRLPDVRVHDLRHACVTLLAAQGVDLKTIADIVGHSDIRLTQNIYQHAFMDAKRSAVDKIGGALEGFANNFATSAGAGKVN